MVLLQDLDALLRKRAEMNIEDSISTLKSLSSLLGQIKQIAINDLVAQNVYAAVQHIDDAQASLKAGHHFQALAYSRMAWENSGSFGFRYQL